MNPPKSDTYAYKVGGSLAFNHPTYVLRKADQELMIALNQRKLCYVFNSRQMGKSSLRVRAMHQLQAAGMVCASVDITSLGSDLNAQQWYSGLMTQLFLGLPLAGKLNLKPWLRDRENLPPVQKLAHFFEEILARHCPNSTLYIFIDEIDKVLSLPFSLDDFFSFIRYCYNQRAENPLYNRLVFALFGVATPSDLIREKTQTPFNIGQAIELSGFTPQEAIPLAAGLEQIADRPQAVINEVITWTGGQPFLTQKVCQLLIQAGIYIPGSKEAASVAQQVQLAVIDHWETQDEPVHLKTIRDRLFRNEQRAGRLLGLYQQILDQDSLKQDNSEEQAELRLSGLVVQRQGGLRVYNPIYRAVFSKDWVQRELEKIRPYSQAIAGWIAADYKDESRLLRGQALQDALLWAMDKNLSHLDYQFLTASQKLDQREAELNLATERKANDILTLANQKAQRMMRLGVAVLSCSLIGAGFALNQALIASRKQAEAQQGTQLERAGDSALRQFDFEQIDALVSAMSASQDLKTLVRDRRKLETYPATSPILALEQILESVQEKNRLIGHQDAVTSVTFNLDGTELATASRDGTVRLWNRRGQSSHILKAHQGDVYGVAFSPDGQKLASVSQDRTLKLWSLNGTLLRTIKGHQESIYSVAFSPNGQHIVTTSRDKTARIWTIGGELITVLRGHQKSVDDAAFSPDGQTVVTASRDGSVRRWNLAGQELWRYEQPEMAFYNVSVSPDGQRIAVAVGNGTILILNEQGKRVQTLVGHSESVNSVTFSREGNWLVSGSNDGTARIWNRQGKLLQVLRGHQEPIFDGAIDSSHRRIATASTDSTVKIWDLQPKVTEGFRASTKRITAAQLDRLGQRVAMGSEAGELSLWNVQGKLQTQFQAHGSRIQAIEFDPQGRKIATISSGGTAKLWTPQGKLLFTFPDQIVGISAGSFDRQGSSFAIATKRGQIYLWDTKSNDIKPNPPQLMLHFHARSERIDRIRLSPDGQLIAEAGEAGTVQIWNRHGKLQTTLIGHLGAIYDLSFSRDGQAIATAARDGTVRLWSLKGQLLHELQGDLFAVYRVSFSPDGQWIATASSDGTARLWDREGNLRTEYKGDQEAIYEIDFSPDGKAVLTVGRDGQVRIWPVEEESERLDRLLSQGCTWLQDYWLTHRTIQKKLPICAKEMNLRP
jgi:WD40 repeat protein